MKKLLYSLLSLFLFTACEEEYKTNIVIPMSNIYLGMPAEGSLMDLNDESKDSYEFAWDKASANGSKLIFSTTKDLVKQISMDAGTGTSFTITAAKMNLFFSEIGIKAGKEALLYWTVKENNNLTAAASEVRTLQIKRMKTKLITPEDMSTVTLLAKAPQTPIKFEWDSSTIGQDTPCQLIFSLDSEMNDAVKLETQGTGSITVSHEELELLVEKLPIKRYNTNIIYWNVRSMKDGEFVSRAASVINMNDMMRFIDIRGNEKITYPVVRIKFTNGTSQVWLADNLRTTKYLDGKEIEAEYLKYAPEALGTDWVKAFGIYYSFVIRDRITPKGWRLPTRAEYNNLFAEAGANGGYDVLKDPIYYYKDPTGKEHLNEWGLGLCSTGVWNLDSDQILFAGEKLYFMAAGFGDPTTWNDPWRALIHDGGSTLWESWAKGTTMRYIYIE